MSDASDPNWNLLPDHPREFFGLGEEFDRTELKRAYNRLIRLYKPEKHPAEFQRIRAAYEDLDRGLRYGEAAPSGFVTIETRGEDLTPAQLRELREAIGKMVSTRETSGHERQSLLQRLREVGSASLYAELKSNANRSATEFLFLAFLSDLHEAKALAFPQWILAGIKAHPESGALTSILLEYLKHPPDKQLPALLKATAAAVGNDRFYYLTETAWQKLLEQIPFPVFEKLLDECERGLQDFRIKGKLVFYVQILRKAMWFADAPWIRRILNLISEHQLELAEHLGYELEMNEVLLDYIKIRPAFLNGDRIRQEIDQTIYRYCVMDDFAALREFLAAQQTLLKSSEELMHAFPIGEMQYNPVYLPWMLISQEIEHRLGDERRELEPRQIAPKVAQLLGDIDRHTVGSSIGFLWKCIDWSVYAMAFVMLVGLPALVWWILAVLTGPPAGHALGLLAGSAVAALNWNLTIPALATWIRQGRMKSLSLRSYRELWRRRLLDFLKLTLIPVEDVLRVVEAFEQDEETASHFQYIHLVSLYLRQDFGLAFYSVAQQFQK